MRRIITVAALVAVVSLGALAAQAVPDQPAGAAQQQAMYVCPMHPDVQATWPAQCPKCGMKLVPKKEAAAKPAPQNADVLYQCPMHPEVISPQPGKCPKCGMTLVAKDKAQIMKEAHAAAGVGKPAEASSAGAAPHAAAGGMSESMAAMHGQMMRRRLMLTVRVDNSDPAAVLALKDALDLSKDQATRIAAIAADARQKTLAVLTEQQKKIVDGLPAEPASLMDLHRTAAPTLEGKDQMPAGSSPMPPHGAQ